MPSRFMHSVSELQFCDRDLLPSFMRDPERERRPCGADAAETQRFFGAEDDFGYLLSADSRQDIEDALDEIDENDDSIDDGTGLEELLVGAWAQLDADDDSPEEGPDSDEPTVLVTTSNIEPMHPVEITRARLRRCISRNGGRQPRRIHDDRTTIRRG